jgi:hypothetical protein
MAFWDVAFHAFILGLSDNSYNPRVQVAPCPERFRQRLQPEHFPACPIIPEDSSDMA